MTSCPSADLLTLLAGPSGQPVAPHVARRLGDLVGGDMTAIALLADVLSPGQLAGQAILPDPLPAVPVFRSTLGGVDHAGRRLLLCAATSVTDRVDVVLRAADVEVDALLTDPVAAALAARSGRFRMADALVRSAVNGAASLATRTAVHAALARAAREVGEPDVALWHTARSAVAGDAQLAGGLVELAATLMGRGDVEAAQEVAREAASHATGERRARSFLRAGIAALWSGHLSDAEDWLTRARSSGVPDVQRDAEQSWSALRVLLDGRIAGSSGVGQAATEPGPGARLARMVEPLVHVAPAPADRVVMTAVHACLSLLDTDPSGAADTLARSVVGSVPAWARTGAWAATSGALSPLAEAHLRTAQALLLTCDAEPAAAATVLRDAVDRLPVAHLAGGLAAEVARHLDTERYGALSPTTAALLQVARVRSAAGTLAMLLRRVPPSGRSVLAALPVHSGPDRDTASDGDADGPAGWRDMLTAREGDVARLVAEGMTNRVVAETLSVSVRTVEVHLGRVFRKLGVRSRSELVVLALRPTP